MNTRLEAIYKQIPSSTCPPRCGKCCGVLFPSLAEIRNVKDWCFVHHIAYKEFTLELGDCRPYLSTEKHCLIYPVRPFLCRILGVIEPLPCPLNRCTPSRVLNGPCSDALYKAIYLTGKEKPRTEKHRAWLRPIIDKELASVAEAGLAGGELK